MLFLPQNLLKLVFFTPLDLKTPPPISFHTIVNFKRNNIKVQVIFSIILGLTFPQNTFK